MPYCKPWIFMVLMVFPVFTWAQSTVSVEDAYVRTTPPVANNSAAFMTLHNTSGQALNLVAAKSGIAKHIELHNHINDNGVMRMRQVPAITLPAKGSAILKPGSYHVMLIGLYQPIKAGDEIEMTLVFSDGSEQTITAQARHIMKHRRSQ